MSDGKPYPVTFAPSTWWAGRPRSWPIFVVGMAPVAVIRSWPLLLFWRPQTASGWFKAFLIVWPIHAGLELFRNPVYENAFARGLAARTDLNASSARVMYLLLVFLVLGVVAVAATAGFTMLVDLMRT